LTLRSELLTFASWQSSPENQIKSTIKQLLGNTISHARWTKRTEAAKRHLAQSQLSAMAHSEHRMSIHKKTTIQSLAALRVNPLTTQLTANEGEQNQTSSTPVPGSSFSYEHDLETRKNNLINRFEFISQYVFGKSVYPNIISPEESLFITDPNSSTMDQSNVEAAELQRTGILTDPKSMLQLTLASDYSIMDIQINAFGKYVQVAYEYDFPSKYMSRWVLEALRRGEVRIVEKLIKSSYEERCLKHHNLYKSIQSQYSEITKSNGAGITKPQSAWAIPGLNLPEVASIHSRLLSLERDLVTLSRIETQRYGLASLHHGIGWMTMNEKGPLVTFFADPLKMAAAVASLQHGAASHETWKTTTVAHINNERNGMTVGVTDEPIDTSDMESLLASASDEHLALLADLPSIDTPHPQDFRNMPAYTSNVLAPVILSKLDENLTLCSINLGKGDETSQNMGITQSLTSFNNDSLLAFHVEIEQGAVFDPITLRRVGFAPRSSTSAIMATPIPSPNPSYNYTGTMHAMCNKVDFEKFAQFFVPRPSIDPSLEDPSNFMNPGIQWMPFGQIELQEDEHLPICAKLCLEKEMPFYYSLFKRLRAISASADPTALLQFYYQTDEAHRLGNAPPAAEIPAKPKKITLRTSKSTTIMPTNNSNPPKIRDPSTPYTGTTLASLYSKHSILFFSNAPIVEDVVMPFIAGIFPQSLKHSHSMIRCLHSHNTDISPTSLMIRSMPFVDSRQIRALVSILRQQASINTIYTSCFNTNKTRPYGSYVLHTTKAIGRDQSDLRSSASISTSGGKPLHSSSMSVGNGNNVNIDLAATPRNRGKRSRSEMESILNSPTHGDSNYRYQQDLNASMGSQYGNESTMQAKEANCKLTIELSSLSEPLFGWSVMVKCVTASSFSSSDPTQNGDTSAPPSAKKPKPNISSSDASNSSPMIFSFSIHISVDGFIHVMPSDCELILNEQRTMKRLENLLRATHHLPLSLQSWLRDIL
jgi:hypothetical protein